MKAWKKTMKMTFIDSGALRMIFDQEDDAFNEIEKQSLWRKRAVQAAMSTNPYRDQVIDEIADAVLRMQGFGKDTLDSFAVYIRGLK
jgi:hypothetical protein